MYFFLGFESVVLSRPLGSKPFLATFVAVVIQAELLLAEDQCVKKNFYIFFLAIFVAKLSVGMRAFTKWLEMRPAYFACLEALVSDELVHRYVMLSITSSPSMYSKPLNVPVDTTLPGNQQSPR